MAGENELHRIMRQIGADRFNRAEGSAIQSDALSRLAPARSLMKQAVPRVSDALRLTAGSWRYRTNQRGADFSKVLETIGSFDELAKIGIKSVVDGLYGSHSYRWHCSRIGRALLDACRMLILKRQYPDAFRKIEMKAKILRRDYNQFRSYLKKVADELGVFESMMAHNPSPVMLGASVLRAIIESSGIIEMAYDKPKTVNGKRYNPRRLIVPTKEMQDWFRNACDLERERTPFLMPIDTEPCAWVSPREGGYPENLLSRRSLVQTDRDIADTLTPEKMPAIYRGVNHLQLSKWAVNEGVHKVFAELWKSGSTDCGLPPKDNPEVPPLAEAGHPREWEMRRERSIVLQQLRQYAGHRILYGRINSTAELLKGLPLYFPQLIDFRGRCYPLASQFQPQGNDCARGLLQFERGMPVDTPDRLRALMTHGANCWGVDKEPLPERIEWVRKSYPKILAIGRDPFQYQEWKDADAPWQFLAFCIEMKRHHEEGDAFRSHLPCAIDASNNGLQIYSMLMRDRATGLLTNVVNTPRPADLYKYAADIATADILEHVSKLRPGFKSHESFRFDDLTYFREFLGFCDGSIPRACSKKTVMTLPYNATVRSNRAYVEEWLLEQRFNAGRELGDVVGDLFNVTRLVTPFIRDAVLEAVPMVVQCMKFLRSLARASAKAMIQPSWTTPHGMTVLQRNEKLQQLRLRGLGGQVTFKQRIPGTVATIQACNAFAPNFVHSLDAAVMWETVNRMKDLGCNDLSMIHDSYAAHAYHMPELHKTARESFVKIFKPDRLAELEAEIVTALPDNPNVRSILKPRPEYGALDVEEILEATYALS